VNHYHKYCLAHLILSGLFGLSHWVFLVASFILALVYAYLGEKARKENETIYDCPCDACRTADSLHTCNKQIP
jgi:hypothetical protein